MTINLKEYTLLSLGDSFTFGQGTVPPHNKEDPINGHLHNFRGRKTWVEDCNNNCYTHFLSKYFKKTVNLGSPGISNDWLYHIMRRYVDLNPNENIFVLFSIGDPQRGSYFDYDKRMKTYRSQSFGYNFGPFNDNRKFLDDYYTIIKNDITLHYDYFLFKRKLQDYFYLKKLKNFVFSAYDITDYRLRKHRHRYKFGDGIGFVASEYIGSITGDFESYMNNIDNDITIINYLNLKKLRAKTGCNTIEEYLNKKALEKGIDKRPKDRVHLSPYLDDEGRPDGHYSRESHIELAKLLENYVV